MYRTDELVRALSVRDLSDPAQGPHAMQLLIADLKAALDEPEEVRHHPLVPVEHNYERLGYPADAVTREARYTRYVSETCMLRSHTTAMIPPALKEATPDVTLVGPGLVYRRDTVDRLHTGTPHQLEVWRISRNPERFEDLVHTLVTTLLPGKRYRMVDAQHPYTTHGKQIDVEHDGEWVEIGEGGRAARHVLEDLPHGLATGWGLDRILMLRKGIPDIRLLRNEDPRIAAQMLDLDEYRPISRHPAAIRDISIMAHESEDIETLGDQIRALTPEDVIEEIAILSETPAEDLPAHVQERLEAKAGQKNVLIRVTMRAPERTLTDRETNEIRDRLLQGLRATAP
ncbi:MAG: phenylalanyl-tRNA synthetase alpha chain [Pseudonocardiales bacterium]|jgi:phenylalanyl-tRNA synthetase alpha chain|nr:phenylalanyl-tRNA synthetase alpha chain [Pseudonocardiales bacterium]